MQRFSPGSLPLSILLLSSTVAVVIGLLAAPVAAAIYRCDAPGGPVLFSQFPCADSSDPESEVRIEKLQALPTISIPPLAETERRRLDALERERRAAAAQSARAAQRQAEVLRQRREQQQLRCVAARVARAALADQRRKGYALADARALDRREAELEAELRSQC